MDIYGVLAHPAYHSLSPAMHNAAFEKLGIDAEYKYFDVPKEDLSTFINKTRKTGIKGFNVSKPHKQAIISLLDEIDDVVEIIGAVNTVMNKNGKLLGTNSDWVGVQDSIKEKSSIKNKNVAILGAGGAARASLYACKQNMAANIIILNRTVSHAKELAKEFNCKYGSLSDFKKYDIDIVIQATSAGMNNPKGVELVPKKYIKSSMIVMELIYSPLETKIIKDGKKAGATTITGERMLLNQGFKSFELLTEKKAPRDVMEEAVYRYL